jgi:hypothetical protein
VILQWTVAGYVAAVTLNPGGIPVRPEGQVRVTPSTSTRYTLIATGPGGSNSKSIEVEVSTKPVEIVSFAGIPTKIKRGESATLTWKVSGPVTELSIQPDVGDVQGKSSINVAPDRTTEYVLTAKAGGKSVKSKVKISVTR